MLCNYLQCNLVHDFDLSWMGNFGHFSCKASLAYSNLCMVLVYSVVANFCGFASNVLPVRCFIPKLAKRLSRSRKLRLGLSSDGVVTRKKVRGKTAVQLGFTLEASRSSHSCICGSAAIH